MSEVFTITKGCEGKNGKVHWEELDLMAFRTYREATEYITNKLDLEPYPVELLGKYTLRFQFIDEWQDVYYAYINSHII